MLLSNKRNLRLGLEVLMGVFSLFFGGTEGLRVFFCFVVIGGVVSGRERGFSLYFF